MKTEKIQNILVTGAAGFIGLDNLNNNDAPSLKQLRPDRLTPNLDFTPNAVLKQAGLPKKF